MVTDPYRDFRQAVDQAEEDIDLGRSALTIAQIEYPDLEISGFLKRIDALAEEVRRRCPSDADAYRTVAALNYVLFNQHGYRGNDSDYYDPKNSFLNQVIERKTGIPITLSVLYMEVARRSALQLDGVGFPGHFLVKHTSDEDEIIIDPFNHGEIKSYDDLSKMLSRLYGGKVNLSAELLQAATRQQILKRILTNLKVIYLKSSEFVKALSVLDRLIILDPAAAVDIRDRGAIYQRLECFAQAREDFECYLRLAPKAEDVAEVQQRVARLAKKVSYLH